MEEKLNDKWINIEEAANYLKVKSVTVRGSIRIGKGIFQHTESERNRNSNALNLMLG